MRPRPTLAVACLALVALAGCGGGDSGDGARPGTVVLADYEFRPRDITVSRGTTLSVVNEGGIAHNLKVERGPNPRRDMDDLAGTDAFLAGDSERLRIDLPPGRYVMVCSVPGHRELGMTGTLTVR